MTPRGRGEYETTENVNAADTALAGMLADAEGQQLVQRILDRKQGY
ncbi:hypothetical protein [Arthrobacter sp. HLT1-21]